MNMKDMEVLFDYQKEIVINGITLYAFNSYPCIHFGFEGYHDGRSLDLTYKSLIESIIILDSIRSICNATDNILITKININSYLNNLAKSK